MEVLGAVASAAALAELGIKGVGFLRDIRETQHNFLELGKEITFIIRLTKDFQTRYDGSARQYLVLAENDRDCIDQAKASLEGIAAELDALKVECERKSASDEPKASKRKWITRGHKVKDLLERAQRAKSNLGLALNIQHIAAMEKQNCEIKEQLASMQQSLVAVYQYQPQVMAMMLSIHSRLPDTPNPETSGRIQELRDESEEDAPIVSDDDQSNGDTVEERIVRFDTSTGFTNSRCSRACECRCHATPWSFRSPSWAKQVVGSWELKYWFPEERNAWELRCLCRRREDMILEWKPPHRGWVKSWFSKPTYTLGCALRQTRILADNDRIWPTLEQSAENFQIALQEGLLVFPDDHDASGWNIVDYMIRNEVFEVLEILLREWASILPRQGFSRNVGYAANVWMLDQVAERDAKILRQITSLVADDLEPEATVLHEAALSDEDMQEELDRLGTQAALVIDELDSKGESALHIAGWLGHANAVNALVAAGADVNRKDGISGWTPLMTMAHNNQTQCMQIVLARRNCRIEEQANNGMTALHVAAWYGFVDAVDLLLRRGARASARDFKGQMPLHKLVQCKNDDSSIIETIAHLLINAKGVDVNCQDDLEQTPVWLAIQHDNAPFLRYLAKAGASFTMIDGYSRTLLHRVALCANAGVLHFLLAWGLPFIDTEIRDDEGNTAWDLFIFVAYAPAWRVGSMHQPNPLEQSLFVQLYKKVRDRNIEHDLSFLEQTLAALRADDATTACSHLVYLSKHKQTCHNEGLAVFYRGIEKGIQAGACEAPIVAIQEELQDLKDELNSSPWDRVSYWDYLKPGSVSELEDSGDEYETSEEELAYSEDEQETGIEDRN